MSRKRTKIKPRQKMRDAERKLKLSFEAHCLDSGSTEKIYARKRQHVLYRIQTPLGESIRTLCPVSFFGKQQLADVMTGTLYDRETGLCLSGDRYLIEQVRGLKEAA